MIVRPAPFPSLGVDCVTILDAVRCAGLKAAGISFVMRYLDTLTPSEVGLILASGLGLGFVSYAPAGGWLPSVARGTAGGQEAVQRLQALGIPEGVCEFTDLEGISAAALPIDIQAWGNARAAPSQASGYVAGLYVGAGSGLTGPELFDMSFTAYWKGLSQVPEPTCGWQLIQMYPTTAIAGTNVDVNAVQSDYHGRSALLVWES